MSKRTIYKIHPATQTPNIKIHEPTEGRQHIYVDNRFEAEDKERSEYLYQLIKEHGFDSPIVAKVID